LLRLVDRDANIDTFFSSILLKAGHVYEVRLNSDPRRPRIEHVYREVVGDS
jgi:hypothetical protein